MGSNRARRSVQLLQQFSIPLVLGVLAALTLANMDWDLYHHLVHTPLTQLFSSSASQGAGHADGWQHYLSLHFLVNDIFMVFFFGLAAKEITEACLPGGALNPVKKAINPLFATIGGVLGPIAVFFSLNAMFGSAEWSQGWGIPTATDIALAWLVARFVFGVRHPAISFLLLLAVADDAIGLGIIALAYPDPNHPTVWANALWILPGMAVAFGLRQAKVKNWMPYIFIGGTLSWWGLYSAHLHPALALVFIVPFLPGPKRDHGLYEEPQHSPSGSSTRLSPLEAFEHQLKLFVDFGLFFFAFANAGVPLSGVTGLTTIVLLSLLLGKMCGITLFAWVGVKIGFGLPGGMKMRHLVVVSVIAGVGLTVALFVSGQAFADPGLQGAAKMGALLSAGTALLAVALGRLLNVREEQRRPSVLLAWPTLMRKIFATLKSPSPSSRQSR